MYKEFTISPHSHTEQVNHDHQLTQISDKIICLMIEKSEFFKQTR